MTHDERTGEHSEEAIEDLEAPAQQQSDVAGGAGCGQPSMRCIRRTCWDTQAKCTGPTNDIVVREL
jgi:hypothetical protein